VTHLSQVNAGRLRVYGSVLSVMEPHNLYLVFITGRQPHSTIHRRGPSLSGCCWSYLEQFTPARHFCVFVACLPVTLQDSSLHHFLSQPVTMYSARAVTLVISDTLIVHIACLLTYLHTLRSAATSSSTANNDTRWCSNTVILTSTQTVQTSAILNFVEGIFVPKSIRGLVKME